MTAAACTDAPAAYQFTDRGLIIVPGLGYDECEQLWQTACAVHRQSIFSLGDAAAYSFDTLGEAAAQFVSDYAPETVRVAMWVCRKIEYSRRRSLSFSLHREVAALPPADQDDLLAKAEAESWRTADMKAAVKARKEAAKSGYPNNSGPAEDELAAGDAAQTPSGEVTEAEAETPPDVVPDAPLALPAPALAAYTTTIDELRSCIEAVRAVAFEIALGQADPSAVSFLSMRILKAMGRELTSYSHIPLLSTEVAQQLIPDNHTIKKTGGTVINGVRQWSVEIRGPAGDLAVAMGPHEPAAIIEVAIAARIGALAPSAPPANAAVPFRFHGDPS